MTVGQLIEALAAFPSDMPVMVNGYESGYDFPSAISVKHLGDSDYDPSYEGRFSDLFGEDPKSPVVVIER